MVVSASPTSKRARQRAILEIVARTPIASQEELVEQLAVRGFPVTQATVSRDVAELRLVKLVRGDRPRVRQPGRPRQHAGSGCRRPARAAPRRDAGDGRAERPDPRRPRPRRQRPGPGASHRPVRPARAGRHSGRRRHRPRPLRRRRAPDGMASTIPGPPGPAQRTTGSTTMKKVILAYSGGLDTSVAVRG